jgi:hypothetical protein
MSAAREAAAAEEKNMSQLALADLPDNWDDIIANLVTEDDEPIGSILSEKQMRLLTEPLYSSWTPPAGEEGAAPRRF